MNKSIVTAFLVLFGATIAISQEMPVVEKKMYTAPDGKLFVQKSLPIYLYLGTKGDDKSGLVTLKSERTGAYSNPLFFDSEGLNTIRTPWCVDKQTKQLKFPKEDIVFEVYADSKAPHTSIKFNSSKTHVQNGKTYVNGKVEIVLSANDQLAGVEKIMYSINGEAYKEFQGSLVFENEQEYALKYFSYDNVGNVEELKTITFVVDHTSPKTSMEIKGDFNENVLSGKAKIVLNTEEGSSGLSKLLVKLNDNQEISYKGPINTAQLGQGEYKLSYYAVDNLGNTEETQEFSFYVDKSAPTILTEIIGKTFMVNGKEFSSGRSQLKLTSLDNKAGVKEVYYSINNGEFKLYDKPVFLSNTGGSLTVKAYAVDYVNNRSEVSDEAESSSIPYIDLSGPSLGKRFSGPEFESADTTYICSKTKILLSGNDAEAGINHITYKLDSKEETDFATSFSIEDAGMHEVNFTGFDNVENSSTAAFKVFVDNKGPELFSRFSTQSLGVENGSTAFPAHLGIFISATDSQSGYERMTYSLNGSKEKAFTGYISDFPKKSNSLKVTAYDKLGNSSTLDLSFSIKK